MDYHLRTPVTRNLYNIEAEDATPFMPVINPPPRHETDQTHRSLTWLMHKPQSFAIFPIPSISGKEKPVKK